MLLAIDTSTAQIGLSLYDGYQVLAESLWTSKARHTVELAPAVNEMLAHTGIKLDEIKALGIAIGPGSFTSLRVGLSFIKGFALARSLPIIGINTLDVLAASQAITELPLACLLSAGRGRLALGWYHANKNIWESAGSQKIVTAVELATTVVEKIILCGDLTATDRQTIKKNPHIHIISPALSTRRPAILAELAYIRWQSGQIANLAALAPLYLHIAEPIPEIHTATTVTNASGQLSE